MFVYDSISGSFTCLYTKRDLKLPNDYDISASALGPFRRKLLLGYSSGEFIAISLITGNIIRTYYNFKEAINNIVYVKENQSIITSTSDGSIRIFDDLSVDDTRSGGNPLVRELRIKQKEVNLI